MKILVRFASLSREAAVMHSAHRTIFLKIIAGLRVVDYLNNEWGRFHHDPCTKNSTRAAVKPFSRSMPVDRTITYLSEHPDETLERTQHQAVVLIRKAALCDSADDLWRNCSESEHFREIR